MSVQLRPGWAYDPERAAGGRRRYNALRQDRAQLRRMKVTELLCELGWLTRGTQARIAELLGVSPATISRDFERIVRETPLGNARCPICCAIDLPADWPNTTAEDIAEHEAGYAEMVDARFERALAALRNRWDGVL